MQKSILVLEESMMIHDLFNSALPEEYEEWHFEHESRPENYVTKAEHIQPDIILLSNRDQTNDYATVKELRSSSQLSETPILLLTFAKDKPDVKLLQSLGVQGFVRKPFELNTLQEQIKKASLIKKKSKPNKNKSALENLNVVDNELLDLLSGKIKSHISMDELDEELEPTLQLLPDEAEAILQDDEETLEELEETELMEMGNDEETETDEVESGSFGNLNVEDIDELELDEAETEAMEIELEKISLDFDENDAENTATTALKNTADNAAETASTPAVAAKDNLTIIQIVQSDQSVSEPVLLNQAENEDDLGFLELDVIQVSPLGKEKLTESFDQAEDDLGIISGEGEGIDAAATDYDDLEMFSSDDEESIEIPHQEITLDTDNDVEDDFDDELLEISIEEMDDDLAETETDFAEAPEEEELEEISLVELDDDLAETETDFTEALEEEELVEISVEALEEEPEEFEENIAEIEAEKSLFEETIDDLDDSDVQEIEKIDDSFDSEIVESEDDSAIIEQHDIDNFEIDFAEKDSGLSQPGALNDESADHYDLEDEQEDLPEKSTSAEASQPDEDSSEEDFDPDKEFDDLNLLGEEESELSIQEMINFRQVMKAKYEIGEETEETDNSKDEEISALSDDFDDVKESELLEEDIEVTEDLFENEELPLEEETEAGEILEEPFSPVDEEAEDVELLADEISGEEDLELISEDIVKEEETEDEEFLSEELSESEETEDMELLADEIPGEEEEIELLAEDMPDTEENELFSDKISKEDEDGAIYDEPTSNKEIDLLSQDYKIEQDSAELKSSPEVLPDKRDTDGVEQSTDSVVEEPIESKKILPLFGRQEDVEQSTDSVAEEPIESKKILPLFGRQEDIENDAEMELLDSDTDEFFTEDTELLMEDESETAEAPIEGIISNNDIQTIDDAEEVTFEMPKDVFEIDDLKIEELDQELDENQELVKEEPQSTIADIDLPSLDEDLPDLPPVLDEEPSFLKSEKTTSLSPEFRQQLSEKIESVITKTVQSTLHEMLPAMMEKIIHEETED